jgi:outer membrane protein TolC
LAIALTLSAEITRTWFSLIEAHAQIELLNEQLDNNQMGLALQEARFASGLIRSPDVLRQRQLVEATLEQIVVEKVRIEVLEHQLAVLLGEMPQTAEYEPGTNLPDLPPLPSTGLPSELLQRRPDVRRDYLAFRAADRDLASAISAQYPRINLTGSLLNVSESPETVFRDWFVSIGAQMIAPLFDGGQRRAEVDRNAAVKRELFNLYGQTMLNAFSEVEDALAQERYQLERIEHLENQVELARLSSEQLREQYLISDATYLDVLSAITAQQRLQRELLSAQLDLVLIRVSLYLALAGDFDTRSQDFELLESTVEIIPETVADE